MEAVGTETRLDPRYALRVMLTITAVALMVNYVETMVIPGVPTIQKDFAITANVASWITSALLIVGSVVAPLFGKLGDIYGKKRMFLIALVFYTIGVGIAGFAPSIEVLLISRAIQGVGFAVIPLALAIIADTFPKERIAPAQGIISGTFAIGATIGLIVGSYVVQDLGWQYAFHTALVFSVILLVLAAKVLKKDTPGLKATVDYAGAFILMAGIALVLVYITEGPSRGWLSFDELAFLVPGLTLTVFFFFFENKRTNPLIHLGLLRIKNVLIANLVGIISGIAMFLLFFAVVYYAQLPSPYGLGLDIIATGLTLGPATLVMLILGPLTGRGVARIGPKPILMASSLVLIAGMVLLIFNRSSTTMLTLDVMVSLAGAVAMIIPIVNMVTVALPKETIAVGLGINTTLRNIGGAIGPILATTIMTTYTTPLTIIIGGQPVVIGQVPSSFAFNTIFTVGIALTVLVVILSVAVKNYTFKKTGTQKFQ